MAPTIGYINNVVIKYTIYYASYMRIAGQAVVITPGWYY